MEGPTHKDYNNNYYFVNLRYTYEMAPLYVMMEKTILNKLQEYVGYENGDGLLFPGYLYNLNLLEFVKTSDPVSKIRQVSYELL